MEQKIIWLDENFNSVPREDWYKIIQLREHVFVVEQFCAYVDCDGKDIEARHIYTKVNDDIAAYCRLLKLGSAYEGAASIGRIATHPNHRGKGYGHLLLVESLKKITQHYNDVDVRIGAQCYLEKFYERYGFKTVTDMYLEDSIPHYTMNLDWNIARKWL